MNKKAEAFQAFLAQNKINCFKADEIQNDKLHTVVFRSSFEISGQQLPTVLIVDDTIYGMIRVLISPKCLNKDNETNLFKQINLLNKKYKSFKYYFDDAGNLVLDCCILLPGDNIDGALPYTMFDVLAKHLNDEYKPLMKIIWQ